jgi:eukaryotic-like serine/threonine-protein kinase
VSTNGATEMDLVARVFEREEHSGRVERVRGAVRIALWAWPAFVLVDCLVVLHVLPGRLWVYLAARGAGLVVVGLAALRLRRNAPPLSRAGLRWLDTAVFALLCALVTVTAGEAPPLQSPAPLGVCTLLVARAAIMSDDWRYGALPVGLGAAAYPVTLALLALLSPALASQLGSPPALRTLAVTVLFLVGSAALTLVGGRLVWTLRRQVFESRSIGRYHLKRRIGGGGMGEAWLADHATLQREVAVKALRSDMKRDPEATARFEREVRATAELRHPNTIRIFDFGVTPDGLCYYAMELLDGCDVADLIDRDGPLHPDRARRLIRQAAQALAEAHHRGIVHRDLKPENLFVARFPSDPREYVKVLDFGLARFGHDEDAGQITQDGFAVGTPLYMPPEVLRGETADARSDIYALGGVLYAMLAGTPPFRNRTMRGILVAHAEEKPPPLAPQMRWPLPADLEAIVTHCLEKDPARRYSSATDFLAALGPDADDADERDDREAREPARPPSSRVRPERADTVVEPPQPRGPTGR